jgi:hypothetical protein
MTRRATRASRIVLAWFLVLSAPCVGARSLGEISPRWSCTFPTQPAPHEKMNPWSCEAAGCLPGNGSDAIPTVRVLTKFEVDFEARRIAGAEGELLNPTAGSWDYAKKRAEQAVEQAFVWDIVSVADEGKATDARARNSPVTLVVAQLRSAFGRSFGTLAISGNGKRATWHEVRASPHHQTTTLFFGSCQPSE